MRINFIVIMVLILIYFSGCITLPPDYQSPLISIPELIIDYDDNETKLWVKGSVYNYKYNEINITIVDLYYDKRITVSEKNTYCTSSKTNFTNFDINITVITKENYYTYNCSVKVGKNSIYEPIFIIIEEPHIKNKEYRIYDKDLPFIRTFPVEEK